MNDLESQLLQSKRIREYVKNFSETQWNRVIKATVILGIQELEKSYGNICKLSAKDIDEIVGKILIEIN